MLSKQDMLKLVEELREFDHSFLSREDIEKFAKPIGAEIKAIKYYDSRNQPKGLTLYDGPGVYTDNRGRRYAYGLDAQVLAMSMCTHLGVKFESKFGRGSQLRACCDALQAYAETLE